MVSYPANWEIKRLDEVCKIFDGTHQTPKYTSRGIRFVSVENIHAIYESEKYISVEDYHRDYKVYPQKGDILMTRIGDIGTPCIISQDEPIAYYVSLALLKYISINNVYLHYYIQGCAFQKELSDRTLHHATPKKINKGEIGKCLVIIPPLQEQKAIADTLAVFDTHIMNLMELIAKKKAIRDGTLEDLMNGRTRLKGFCGDWEVKNFDEMFIILSNNTLSRDKLTTRGKIGNIHYGDVLIKYASILTIKDSIPRIKTEYEASAQKFLRKNDIIIADTAEDETVGKAVQIGDVNIPLVAGLHTIPCRPVIDTAPGYLGYYINCKLYHDQLLPYITGIKVSSISKSSIRKTKIKLPSLEEQIAIADTLTALDTEITALETEREKISQIRDGAMNDLLTGKVRLLHGNRKTATEPRKTLAD